ncbi:MAG TPA: hypothetical protein VI216_02945 [Candidatus Acidoferrales bacterium]
MGNKNASKNSNAERNIGLSNTLFITKGAFSGNDAFRKPLHSFSGSSASGIAGLAAQNPVLGEVRTKQCIGRICGSGRVALVTVNHDH